MKLPATILALLAGASLTAQAELPADWGTNYQATLASSVTNQRPALVYFTASWCGPCKLMTRIILTDPVVSQTLASVNHVAVDIDEHSDLASQHGIQAVPTFLLLAAGQEVDRTTGFRPASEFYEWLTNGVQQAQAAVARQTFAKNEMAEADQLLAATNTDSNRLAAAKLLDLCAERDDALVKAAVGRLQTLAAHDPIAVLDGLEDSRLAARIQAANALRATLGDAFDVDPWSDAATLRKNAQDWREKLAKPAH